MKQFLFCFLLFTVSSSIVFAQTAEKEVINSKSANLYHAGRKAGGIETQASEKYPTGFETGTEFTKLYASDGPLSVFDQQSEILDLRDAYSKHFRNANGTVTALVTSGPQHYLQDGLWQTILQDITTNNSVTYPYINKYNKHHTFYGNNADGIFMVKDGEEQIFKIANPRLSFLDAQGNELGGVTLTSFASIQHVENKIIYSEVSPGIDVIAEQNAAGVKYSYVIKNQQAFLNLPQGIASIGISENLNISSGFQLVDNGSAGKIIFRKGEQELQFKKFLFYDSNPNQNREKATHVAYDGNALSYSMNAAWFTDPNRVFPIYIDPTATYTPTAAIYWTGTVDEDSGCDFATDNDDDNEIRVGFDDGSIDNDYYSGYAKFNINALPADACIQDAYSRFFQFNYRNTQSGGQCWGNDDQLEYYYGGIGPITFDPVPSTCDQIQTAIFSGPIYQTLNVFSGYPYGTANGWKDYTPDLSAVVTSARAVQNYMTLSFDQFNSHSDPGFNFCCFCTPDNDDWIDYRGWSDANRPQLVVTYQTPYIIGTAANVSVNNVCAGTGVQLTLAGGTNGSDGSWHWYSGSCGGTPVGTSTAANAALNITAPSTTTTYYVRGEGTCGNTICRSVTLTVLQPSVAATSINASSNPICQGGSGTTLSVVGGSLGAGATWQWYTGACGVTPAGSGSAINVNPGTTTIYYVRAEGTCNTTVCRQITVTVNTPTVGGTPSIGSPSVCINNTVGVNLSGQNGAVLFWEMQLNGGGYNSIGNAGLTSITSPSLTTAGTYDFRARVQNSPCAALYSNTTSVTVVPASVGGTASPALSPVCINGNTTVSLSGNVGAIVSWERQVNGGGWINIGNAGLNNIPTGVLNTSGTWQFRAIVQNSPCGSTTSSIANITVNSPSVGGFAGSTGTLICNGSNPTISLSGQTGTVMYWEQQINGGGFNNIGNSGLTSFSAGPLVPGTYSYRAVVENSPCVSATSTSINITVSDFSVGGSAVPNTTQLCQGSSTNITLSGQTGTILYWEKQVNGGGWVNFGNPGLAIINSGILSAGNNEFRAVIQNGGCAAVNSTPALIVVDPTSVGGSITPNFTSVCDGSSVTLILSGNTGSIVQWERQYNGGGWISLGNAGVNPLVTSALSPFGTYEFRALVQSGVCSSTFSLTVPITVNQNDNPAFNYSSSVFCQGSPNASPTIAQGGGTFSAVPAGLAINASNGIIDLSASTPGTYTITHTTSGICPSSSNQVVTITPLPNASFSYGSLSYCLNAGTNPVPTATIPGGIYTTLNPGLIFTNASTGEINLALSQPGSYFVQYSLGGSCPSSSVQTVILKAAGNSSFTYPATSYCLSANNPIPTVSQFGGTFSSVPFGLSFANNQTGEIDMALSQPGVYTITYNSGGPCPTTTSQIVTLNAAGDPLFFYFASNFCKAAANPTPFVSQPGGGFTSSPAGLIFVSPVTGEISLAASQPGNYTITYNTGGICPSVYTQDVVIIQNENATFNYSQPSYCQYDANPVATVAEIGGTFTSVPAGLVFANQFTGLINLSASSAGTYSVTYTVPGTCVGVYSQQVIINVGASASLSYPVGSFCSNGTDPLATYSPVGGIFTSSPSGLSINATGTIDLSASAIGAYTVYYTAPGLCGSTVSDDINIVQAPQAFIQPLSTLCTGSPATILSASPSGGTWSGGAYVNASGVFDPSISGAGSFPVNYVVNGSGGCSASATYNVVVNSSPSINITAIPQLCSNDTSYVLTATPAGGSWNGNPFVSVSGLFYPIFAGAGLHPVIYTYNNGGCVGSASASIVVLNSPNPVINPTGIICSSGGSIGLSSNISGGTWSGGPYVSASGTFNPALASVGNNSVTYTVVSGVCTAQSTAQIAVSGGPNVNILTPAPFCENDSPDFVLANIPGGVFTGGGYVSGTGLFNPANAVIGNNIVMYTLVGNNGCVGADTVNVVVNTNPDATITYPGLVCEDAPAFNLTAATAGGVWSGGAYVNSGIFDPGVAGVGSHTVTYIVTTGSCSSSETISVTIEPNPFAIFNHQPNGLITYFTDLSLNVDSWLWNFGDGSPEVTDQNPTHLFPDNGTYQVRLIAYNDCGSDTLIRGVIVNKAVGINENSINSAFNIFPNPTDQFLQLTATNLEVGSWLMSIIDISGKEVILEELYTTSGQVNKTIDVQTLKPGIYFINLRNSEQQYTLKFIRM